MPAVAAGCRKALANARWAIVLLSCTNGPRPPFHLVGAPFLSDILGSFQSGGVLSGWRALTIERLLMSGCGQGHELVKDMWKKLWLKFPGLMRSRNGNTAESLNKTSRKYNSVVKGLTEQFHEGVLSSLESTDDHESNLVMSTFVELRMLGMGYHGLCCRLKMCIGA